MRLTRFAPSPTGHLHLGHVVNAIYVWGLARTLGARVLLRVEDHDRIRSRPEFERAILADLAWLGFVPDEGLMPLRRQSENNAAYESALARLQDTLNVYVCDCSRKEIARLCASPAPPERGGDWYPGRCRDRRLRRGESVPAGAGIRVQLDESAESFHDLALGEITQTPADQCGDLLLRDRDGNWTYQFAVTVDDMNDGVDLVIRGLDLLASTGRQIKLARMLGRHRPPAFFHHPLVIKPDGEKLSKASGDTGIQELRGAGASPAEVVGLAAASAGIVVAGTVLDADTAGRLIGVRTRGHD